MALTQSNNHTFSSGELVTATKLNNVKAVQTDTATNNNNFTGSAGQLTYDTTANKLRVHDGSTAGGLEVGAGAGSVTSTELASSAVTTDKINDNAVTSAKIGSSAVTTTKIDDSAVTSAKINNDAVTSDKIADGAVTSAKLADNSVTNSKINISALDVTNTSGLASIEVGASTDSHIDLKQPDTDDYDLRIIHQGTTLESIHNSRSRLESSGSLGLVAGAVPSTATPGVEYVTLESNGDFVHREADFTIQGTAGGILLHADKSDYRVNLAPTNVGGGLAVFNPNGPTTNEGGQIAINKSTESAGTLDESKSFSLDAFKDTTGTYQHGTNAELLRLILTTQAATVSWNEDGDMSTARHIFPVANNSHDLGKSSLRYRDVYCSRGAFNGSDKNLKQDIEDLDEAEKRVAVKAKALIKKYRLKDSVEKKGDKARIHVGIIAQELQEAFESEGLDPFRYSMIGKDTWWEKEVDGKIVVTDVENEGATKVTQMQVRYSELFAFIISAL